MNNGSTITIDGDTKSIYKIVVNYTADSSSKNGDGSKVTADVGTYSYSKAVGTWEGESSKVVITTKKASRVKEITVSYYNANSKGDNTVYTYPHLWNLQFAGDDKTWTDIWETTAKQLSHYSDWTSSGGTYYHQVNRDTNTGYDIEAIKGLRFTFNGDGSYLGIDYGSDYHHLYLTNVSIIVPNVKKNQEVRVRVKDKDGDSTAKGASIQGANTTNTNWQDVPDDYTTDGMSFVAAADGDVTISLNDKGAWVSRIEVRGGTYDDGYNKSTTEYTLTGAGTMAGGNLMQLYPGINLTYGAAGDDWTVAEENGRLVASTSTALELNGNIPTKGTFYKFEPRVNGYLTLDANFTNGTSTLLVDNEGNTTATIENQSDYNGTYKIGGDSYYQSFPLLADKTYYLYTGVKLHGFKFEPSFISVDKTTDQTGKTVTVSIEDDPFSLPYLINDVNDTRFKTADDKTNGVIKYDTDVANGRFNFVKAGTATVEATVSSEEGSNSIVVNYTLTITDNRDPKNIYMIADKAQPKVNQRVAPENGGIYMTFGGWTTDGRETETGDEYDDSSIDSKTGQPKKLTDSWSSAKYDDCGREGQTIDGFLYPTNGSQNGRDELHGILQGDGVTRNTSAYNKENPLQFMVPCRGSFTMYEPEVDGELTVYVQQNGSINNDSETGFMTPGLSWRPIYIIDEKGQQVEGVEAKSNRKLRTLSADDLVFLGYDSSNARQKAIIDSRTAGVNILHTTLGESNYYGYVAVEKCYARYRFNVKAGKTYFVFANGTKLGFCGFMFVKDASATSHNVTLDETATTDFTIADADKTHAVITNSANTRKLTAGVWNAVVVPFSMNKEQVKDVFGTGTEIIYCDDDHDRNEVEDAAGEAIVSSPRNVLYFKKHYYQYIVAGRPCFIKPKNTASFNIASSATYPYVTIDTEIVSEKPLGTTSDGCNYSLYAAYEQKAVGIAAGDYYFGTDGNIYRTDEEDTNAPYTIKGFRAYIKCTSRAAGAKGLLTTFIDDVNDELTVIEGITADSVAPRAMGVYNINGQKYGTDIDMQKLPKGVYIVNGKKYIAK